MNVHNPTNLSKLNLALLLVAAEENLEKLKCELYTEVNQMAVRHQKYKSEYNKALITYNLIKSHSHCLQIGQKFENLCIEINNRMDEMDKSYKLISQLMNTMSKRYTNLTVEPAEIKNSNICHELTNHCEKNLTKDNYMDELVEAVVKTRSLIKSTTGALDSWITELNKLTSVIFEMSSDSLE